MPKICGITTLPGTIKSFMLENLEYMAQNGYEAYCISAPGNVLNNSNLGQVKYLPINGIKWGIMSPITFCKCVYRLYKIFRKERFDIIQYATSNAALCASIAGWLARVPVRINCQWGISYPIFKGPKRWLFYYSTLINCKLSTSVQPDSNSNLKFSIENKLYPASKGTVIFNGSACGVNLERFNINKKEEWRKDVIERYNLSKYTHIFGFVGRLVVEKGINELMEAFIQMNDSKSCLILVGRIDNVDRLKQNLWLKIKSMENVRVVGPVSNPEVYYAAFDFMMLPSYQEGFGMSVLEAAGLGCPSIISNIKGPTDLITDGINGFVCEPKSSDSLLSVMYKAKSMNISEYYIMSKNSYNIAKERFDTRRFKELFFENRDTLLQQAKSKRK